jgi:uncharacterized protein YciI
MPFFAVIGMDNANTAPLRALHGEAHRDYFRSNGDLIKLSGAMYDEGGNQCGSLVIFEAPDAETVRQWLRNEPFRVNDVYRDLTVIEWRPSLNRMEPISGW